MPHAQNSFPKQTFSERQSLLEPRLVPSSTEAKSRMAAEPDAHCARSLAGIKRRISVRQRASRVSGRVDSPFPVLDR